MKIQYISEERLKRLQESIGWLDNLKSEENILFVVGESLKQKDWNIQKTQTLQQIMYHNKQLEKLKKEILE